MLRSLSLKTVGMIVVALPIISQCPPTWLGGSSVPMATTVAEPVPPQTITVVDPVGDALHDAPAFQDIVLAEVTMTAGGSFDLLMEMAGSVPAAPPMPSPGNHEIWWFWGFDLDPAVSPQGYPLPPGNAIGFELVVYVSWDGTAFTGAAIDRRPLLTGGEAVITPVPFSINGTVVEAALASTLIGEVPPSFGVFIRAMGWSSPVGQGGTHFKDGAELYF